MQTMPALRRASSESTITIALPLPPLPTPKPPSLDPLKCAAFLSRITSAINDSATCIQLSLGHKLNLLQQLHRAPHTSADVLAKHNNLSERYVEEWLAGVSCADTQLPRNAAMACVIPALARAEGELMRAFRDGRPARVTEMHALTGGLYPRAEQLLQLYPGVADGAHVGVVGGMCVSLVEGLARQAAGSWFSAFSEKKRKSGGNLHWCEWKDLSGCGYLDVALVVDGGEVERRWWCVGKLRDALRVGGVLLFVDVCGGGGVFGGTLGMASGGCGGRQVVEKRLEGEGFDVVDVHRINEMCSVIVAMIGS